MKKKHWKISDFAKKLNKHKNTVDGWFRQLETEWELHYIARMNDEKVYDELDLEIGKFIVNKREEKWSLGVIFEELPKQFQLRSFPEVSTIQQKKMNDNETEEILINEMKLAFEELATTLTKEQTDKIQKLVPSLEQKRLDRVNSILIERKVTRMLEKKALGWWNAKPEEERMMKVGWFRKEEDVKKKNQFINEYIDEHFEDQLKREFNVQDSTVAK